MAVRSADMRSFVDQAAATSGVIDNEGSTLLSFDVLRDRSRRVSGALAEWGVGAGDRAALLLPNGADWFVAHLALANLGVLTVPVNTRLTTTEVTDLVRNSGSRLLVVDPDFLDLGFGELAADLVTAGVVDRVVTTGASAETIPGARTLAELVTVGSISDVEAVAPDSPLICFGTSGTTGAPKLAVHTHGGTVEHCEAVATALGLNGDDVVLGILPPCGAYGYTVAMAALAAGARYVPLPTFAPATLLEAIRVHRATFLAVTEAILRAATPPGGPPPGTVMSWRLGVSAGGSFADLVSVYEQAGVRIANVYGASEVLAVLAVRDPAAPATARAAAGGTLVDSRTQVRAVTQGTDEWLPDGTPGELQFHGPSVFVGYLDNPAATVQALSEGGWYRSGDSGQVDPGGRSFDYLSRLTDTLRLKGFLVDPAQVEEVLLAHPDVGEAQVVGVPAVATGEDVAVAFAVVDGTADTGDLRSWCEERLAVFKVPTRIEAADHIPTTPSANGDKALKRALRERAAALLEEDK